MIIYEDIYEVKLGINLFDNETNKVKINKNIHFQETEDSYLNVDSIIAKMIEILLDFHVITNKFDETIVFKYIKNAFKHADNTQHITGKLTLKNEVKYNIIFELNKKVLAKMI
jgi:hypothetical protein